MEEAITGEPRVEGDVDGCENSTPLRRKGTNKIKSLLGSVRDERQGEDGYPL